MDLSHKKVDSSSQSGFSVKVLLQSSGISVDGSINRSGDSGVIENSIDGEVVDLISDSSIDGLDSLNEDSDDLIEDLVLLLSSGLLLGVPLSLLLSGMESVIEGSSGLEVDLPSLVFSGLGSDDGDQ